MDGIGEAIFPYHLPDELVVKIFSLLPPENLVQAKCVGHSWYYHINHLIKDPSFIAQHLKNSSSTKYIVIRQEQALSLLTMLNNDRGNGEIRYETEDFSSRFVSRERYARDYYLRYHCNGIFCMHHELLRVFTLFNPSIKELRKLPPPSITDCWHPGIVGFGYDQRTNDYKIINIALDRFLSSRAEVYRMSSDSWMEIELPVETPCAAEARFTAYCQGVFYCESSSETTNMLVSFDMSEEVFRTILFPQDRLTAETSFECVNVWNESLTLFLSNKDRPLSIEMWVLNTLDSTWYRHLTFERQFINVRPFKFHTDDELVMMSSIGGNSDGEEPLISYACYNINSQRFRPLINVEGAIEYWDFSFTKSLVPVEQ
ncbi:F-box domain containing protein [Trema orientale]|uniref:F-box domain containing protein n=1 Tax=Trema orientale TaxID=63057 RepID=A0A2P5FPT0_TREOI|nr:F-box domain containing protein [Trema orientale]